MEAGTQVLHGGTSPTWGSLSLTADVTGILPVTNGGTGASTLLTNAVLYGNGTGVVSNTGVSTGAGQFLQTTASGGAPSWKSVLAVANGGTGLSSYTTGNMLYASGATTLAALAPGSDGNFLTYDGTNSRPKWSSSILPILSTTTAIVTSNATTIPNNVAVVKIPANGGVAVAITMPSGTDGQVLYLYNDDATANTTNTVVGAKSLVQFVYFGAWLRVTP